MSGKIDVESWIETIKDFGVLAERDLRMLCEKVKELLIEESNVQPVSAPVTICGDIHGQFSDLLELFKKGGDLPNTRYVFMGDFVGRGFNSCETFELLLCLKLKYPGHITLLRGNHETRQITQASFGLDRLVEGRSTGGLDWGCVWSVDCTWPIVLGSRSWRVLQKRHTRWLGGLPCASPTCY